MTELEKRARDWRQINWYGSDGEQVDKALRAFAAQEVEARTREIAEWLRSRADHGECGCDWCAAAKYWADELLSKYGLTGSRTEKGE